jgi:hypothetical protein
MSKLGIYLPTWHRPNKLQEVATNIENATHGSYTLYFGCEPDDLESIRAARATGHPVIINKYEMGYSNTIQSIYEVGNEQIFFHANDDFYFPKNWNKACMDKMKEKPEVYVMGAMDGTSNQSGSTISFIRRTYIKRHSGVIDMPNRVFYPYNHNFQDTEFTKTAQHRGMWDVCLEPCIEHRREGDDETYQKNNATYHLDNQIYDGRKRLFNG